MKFHTVDEQNLLILVVGFPCVPYHGFLSEIGKHARNFVLVHVMQFGVNFLLCVNYVFLQKILGYYVWVK